MRTAYRRGGAREIASGVRVELAADPPGEFVVEQEPDLVAVPADDPAGAAAHTNCGQHHLVSCGNRSCRHYARAGERYVAPPRVYLAAGTVETGEVIGVGTGLGARLGIGGHAPRTRA